MEKQINLNEINTGSNKFCGPAVLSAIAGISTDEAAKVINTLRHRPSNAQVTGVYPSELNLAFSALGYKVSPIYMAHKKSIFMMMTTMDSPGIYLFYVPRHVVAIEIANDGKRYIIDNHTKRPLNIGSSARLGQKVDDAVKITKNA